MNNEFEKEQMRGLFATALLVMFVSALIAGNRLVSFPTNFGVSFFHPFDRFFAPVTVPFQGLAVTYVALWTLYAFAMSIAYSGSGARLVSQQCPQPLRKLIGLIGRLSRILIRKLIPKILRKLGLRILRELSRSKFWKVVGNICFFGGLFTVLILACLIVLWWGWFLVHHGVA